MVGGRVREWQWQQVVGLWAGWVGGWVVRRVWRGGGGW